MPTYEYQCDRCHNVFEIRQRISEPALTTHDDCGGSVRRLLSPAPFILKGGGWYVTDYPSESRKKAVDAEKSSTTAPAEKPDKPADKPDKPASSTAKSDGGGASSTSGASSAASKPAD